MAETYALVYDCKLRRPGCVLLQVAMGGTVPSELFHRLFSNETWLLAPTDNMKLYRATEAELKIVAQNTKARKAR